MRLNLLLAVCFVPIAMLKGQSGANDPGSAPTHAPSHTADGRLLPLTGYREWIYLTSGLDMNYAPRAASVSGHSIFDNVFVTPESYRSFLKSGTWPDKTVFVWRCEEPKAKFRSTRLAALKAKV